VKKNNRKKILHLIYRFDVGGMEKVMADTINALPKYTHIIITLTQATAESRKLINDDIEIFEINKKEGNDFNSWKLLYKLLRKLKPQVLHSYNLPTLEYQLIGFICRIPLRIHAEHGRYASDPLGKSRKYRLYRKIMNPLIHFWVPVSMDLAEWLKHYISIPQSKIQLIYNGINTDYYAPDEKDNSGRYLESFSSADDIILGTIGRLDPVKNQKLLIEAFAYIIESRPQLKRRIKLAIIGSGPLKDQLSEQIRSLNLEKSVWLPGPRSDIKKLLSAFDMFILPSIAEGIPMTILEAMSMAKPVIASNVGGIPEIIKPGTGILVTSNNTKELSQAVLSLLDNMESCYRMGELARHHVLHNFSLKTMIEKYNNLYSGASCVE
jgi:sugar transferase (PEP-CTERM/EpsH1 system associated)